LQRRPKAEPGKMVIGNETVIKLAGIMNGFFGDFVKGQLIQTRQQPTPYNIVNYGISAVTPAYLLWDILNSEELKKNRQQIEIQR
jgi:hypothetical protein